MALPHRPKPRLWQPPEQDGRLGHGQVAGVAARLALLHHFHGNRRAAAAAIGRPKATGLSGSPMWPGHGQKMEQVMGGREEREKANRMEECNTYVHAAHVFFN